LALWRDGQPDDGRLSAVSADEDDAERQQVEWVFGLTGGELDDEPWNGFRYNFEGVPDWARPDFKDRYDREYRTVVSCFLYGGPPERIVDASGEWTLQATYGSSGETECPLRDIAPEEQEAIYAHREKQFNLPHIERCFLCDEERGDDHGYIYLGDGWADCVFRLEGRDTNYDDEYDDEYDDVR
jgi:hypothetical protein